MPTKTSWRACRSEDSSMGRNSSTMYSEPHSGTVGTASNQLEPFKPCSARQLYRARQSSGPSIVPIARYSAGEIAWHIYHRINQCGSARSSLGCRYSAVVIDWGIPTGTIAGPLLQYLRGVLIIQLTALPILRTINSLVYPRNVGAVS